MKAIDLLRLQYPQAFFLTLAQVSNLTGFAINTIRNRIRARTWPIPAHRESLRGRLYFDIRDVAAYLDKRAEGATRRRGRPTKAELIEKRNEGTVQ